MIERIVVVGPLVHNSCSCLLAVGNAAVSRIDACHPACLATPRPRRSSRGPEERRSLLGQTKPVEGIAIIDVPAILHICPTPACRRTLEEPSYVL